MSLLAGLLALAAAPAAAILPNAAALEQARIVAGNGTLATLGPLLIRADTESLIKDNPGLSPTEQARLRTTAKTIGDRLTARLLEAEAQAFAANLSAADLTAIATFARSPAATRQRAAMPKVIIGTMAAMQSVDFKSEVRKAYCSETGKLCGK